MLKKAKERSGSGRVRGWLLVLAVTAMAGLARWADRPVRDEAGNVITDNLAWIVFGVVAIVVIGGLLETLGRSVVSWVSGQLGL